MPTHPCPGFTRKAAEHGSGCLIARRVPGHRRFALWRGVWHTWGGEGCPAPLSALPGASLVSAWVGVARGAPTGITREAAEWVPVLSWSPSEGRQELAALGLDWVTHRGPFQPLPFCDSGDRAPSTGCCRVGAPQSCRRYRNRPGLGSQTTAQLLNCHFVPRNSPTISFLQAFTSEGRFLGRKDFSSCPNISVSPLL